MGEARRSRAQSSQSTAARRNVRLLSQGLPGRSGLLNQSAAARRMLQPLGGGRSFAPRSLSLADQRCRLSLRVQVCVNLRLGGARVGLGRSGVNRANLSVCRLARTSVGLNKGGLSLGDRSLVLLFLVPVWRERRSQRSLSPPFLYVLFED